MRQKARGLQAISVSLCVFHPRGSAAICGDMRRYAGESGTSGEKCPKSAQGGWNALSRLLKKALVAASNPKENI
jgi:hypothetical protein